MAHFGAVGLNSAARVAVRQAGRSARARGGKPTLFSAFAAFMMLLTLVVASPAAASSPPSVTSISPTLGTTLGGDSVTINGSIQLGSAGIGQLSGNR